MQDLSLAQATLLTLKKSQMKVLHLVSGSLSAGAAKGAYYLHQGLLKIGVDSHVLTDSNETYLDKTVTSISKNAPQKIVRAVQRKIDTLPVKFYGNREDKIFSTGLAGFNFIGEKAYQEADVVHMHWINNGFVKTRDFSRIDKPVIWTIRDMWPLTGGCHYSMGCIGYKSNCGDCPQLKSKNSFDLSRFIVSQKKKHFQKSMKIIGISNWISELASDSSVFNSFDVRTIPNCINTEDFFPIEKTLAKLLLGIDTAKKIVLIGAQSVSDFYKGFDKFLDALDSIDAEKYHICFFGNAAKDILINKQFTSTMLGFLHDPIALRIAYSCADVFVAPSIQEAFGKTIAEAMACGVPVVCFDATGPKDIVDHKINGYLAVPFESKDIADGINWICDNENYLTLRVKARDKIVKYFNQITISEHYKKIYDEVFHDEKFIIQH